MHILEKNPSLKTAMELSEALKSLDEFHGTFEEREMLELRIKKDLNSPQVQIRCCT